MKTASQIVHALAGAPAMDACAEVNEGERCWVCGGVCSRGIPLKKWLGPNFTNFGEAKCKASKVVCEACAFVCSRTSPVPGRPAGKCQLCDGGGKVVRIPKVGIGRKSAIGDDCPKCEGSGAAKAGGNFRNYSHLYDSGWAGAPYGVTGEVTPGYMNASKGEKPAIVSFLRGEKTGVWFAAIADSAQKHVLPWAPINAPGVGGVVLFDDLPIRVPDVDGWIMVDDMADLLTAAATKDEIERGDYTPRTFGLARDEVLKFEGQWAGLRGSSWFRLAVWLAQRDEEKVSARISATKAQKGQNDKRGKKRKTEDANGRAHVGDAPSVPPDAGREPVKELGDPSVAHARRRADNRKPRRVGKQDSGRASGAEHQQLLLEGLD